MAVIKEETEDLRIAEVFSLSQEEMKKRIDLIPLKEEILNQIKEEKHLDEEQCDFIAMEKNSSSSQTESTAQEAAEETGTKRDFTCQQCGKCFVKKGHFENHLRTHTGESSFTCEHCGNGYTQKRNLRNHMRLLTEQNSLVCQRCKKRFCQIEDFKKHMRGHSEKENPYACLQCGKIFVHKAYGKVHIH